MSADVESTWPSSAPGRSVWSSAIQLAQSAAGFDGRSLSSGRARMCCPGQYIDHEVGRLLQPMQAVERLREAIDLGIEVADLGRSVAFRARGIVAGLELRERRPATPRGLTARPTRRLVTPIAASASSPPSSAFSRASSQTSSISSAGSATRMIDSVPPFFSATGMTAVSAGAPTRARNQRGASDSLFASLRIEEASDGSPIPARTCRRCCRLATRFLTTFGSGASGESASVVATKSLVSRIALCVSARDSPARLPNVMDRVGHEPEREQRGER